LRPIEEESDNEEYHRADSPTTVTSATGSLDVITASENPFVANGQCAVDKNEDKPISDRVDYDVITTDQSQCVDDDIDIILETPSQNVPPPNSIEGYTGNKGVIPDDVTEDTASKQRTCRQLQFYVIVASLTAFVAWFTSMSPCGVFFVVTITSLVVHHITQS